MRLKKMLSMILVVMVVISCFAIGTAQVSAISFTPRLSAPDGSNPYYYDGSYNVYQRYGYGMPNCTAYAFGRAYEILGHEPNLSWYSAENWYGDNIASGAYDYGQTPKVGAIACWTYGYGGHVAVVEDIDDDGNMILSNSAWSGTNFYLTYAHTSDSNPGGNDWWTFQGYIYLIDSAESSSDTVKQEVVDNEEDEDSDDLDGINQYTGKVVTDFFINMRSKPSVSSNVINVISPDTELNITETKSSDGYTWGKTKYNGGSGWVALDFCSRVDDESTEPSGEQSITPVSNKYKLTDASAVYLRSSATTSSSISDIVYKGTELTITETKTNDGYTWGKTIYDGVSGWVALDYFTSSDGTPAVQRDEETEQTETDTEAESDKKPGFYRIETADYLNMRSDSTLDSKVINCLINGTELIVTEVKVKDNYTWGKVVYDKKTGWIALDYCKLIEQESENNSTKSASQKVENTNNSDKTTENVDSGETVETTIPTIPDESENVEETTAPIVEETTAPVVEETTTPEIVETVVEETKPTENTNTPKAKNKPNIKIGKYCDFNKDGVISIKDMCIFDKRLHVFKNQINLNSMGIGYSISDSHKGKFLKELISKIS